MLPLLKIRFDSHKKGIGGVGVWWGSGGSEKFEYDGITEDGRNDFEKRRVWFGSRGFSLMVL